MSEEMIWRQCVADECREGRCPCPCPNLCWTPARSWFLSDLSVIGIGVLVLVGFVCGWFS